MRGVTHSHMMNRLLRALRWCVAAAVAALPIALGAQRAGVVLALPASARAAGAGDAAVLATGAGALFYGGQRLPSERAVEASAGSWIGGAQFSTVAVAIPSWRGSAVALGVQSLDYGSADEIVPDPLTGGTRGIATGDRVSAGELAVSAGVAAHVRRVRFGVTAEYLHQQVANLSGSTIASSQSVGAVLRGWDVELAQLHAGPSLNVGASSSSLVLTHRASVLSPSRSVRGSRWQAFAEWRNVRGEGAVSLLGVEGTATARSGWRLLARGAVAAMSTDTARDPWSVGGSAARGSWSLDYAYQGFGALGAVHRMGVTWRSRDPRNPSR